MDVIGIRELRGRTSEVLRRVRTQHETIAVTYRGKIVARIVPVEQPPRTRDDLSAIFADMDELAAEISAQWPADVTAVEAINEGRRTL